MHRRAWNARAFDRLVSSPLAHTGNHDVECIPRHVLHNVMKIKSTGGSHTSYYDFAIGNNIRAIVLDVFEISAFSKEGSEERYVATEQRTSPQHIQKKNKVKTMTMKTSKRRRKSRDPYQKASVELLSSSSSSSQKESRRYTEQSEKWSRRYR